MGWCRYLVAGEGDEEYQGLGIVREVLHVSWRLIQMD